MNPIDPAHDTRTRLLLAAVQVFAAKNFEGSSIREIARQAGANSALIQYYFGGKEGLYLEAVKFVFAMGCDMLRDLPPLPAAGDAGARVQAVECLKAYIRNLVKVTYLAPRRMQDLYGPEVEQAAFSLWTREMQSLHPTVVDFIQEAIAPFMEYLRSCLLVLLPDLTEESLFRLSLSIQGQLTHLHSHMGLVKLRRSSVYTEPELDSLSEHFIQFSLRGLGIPEAFPLQGA